MVRLLLCLSFLATAAGCSSMSDGQTDAKLSLPCPPAIVRVGMSF